MGKFPLCILPPKVFFQPSPFFDDETLFKASFSCATPKQDKASIASLPLLFLPLNSIVSRATHPPTAAACPGKGIRYRAAKNFVLSLMAISLSLSLSNFSPFCFSSKNYSTICNFHEKHLYTERLTNAPERNYFQVYKHTHTHTFVEH